LEELADRVNPMLRRDQAAVESARGLAVQAALLPNPQWNTNNPWVINGRGTLLNAGFQQEIPVMGKKRLDKAAADEATRQAELTYFQNRAALHALIRQQFHVVLVDQERVRVLTRLAEIARQSHEAVVLKRKAGDATEIDVRLLQVAAERAEGARRSAAAILEGDRQQLEAIVGAPGTVRGPVQGPLTGPYPEFDERGLIAYVTRNHTQVEAALSVIRQNRVLVRRAEVEPYPNPTMGPAYQFGLVPGNDQFWLNFTFNIPVWDRNQGNIRAAKANLVAAAESADVTRLNLVNQAANLLSQYRAARAIVERFESGVLASANEAVRLAQAGYAKGVVDRATLLQTQQAAAQANSDYVDALQNLWSNATQLSGLLQLERFP
jgi:cobalt-zinc-cadmium efflux system outer membrane protein